MKITTNYARRPLLSGYELAPKEREDLNYIAPVDNEERWLEQTDRFFRYRGQIYDMHEFSRIIPTGSKRYHPMEWDTPEVQGWDGYYSDSYFSGLLIRYATIDLDRDGYVIVAMYTS